MRYGSLQRMRLRSALVAVLLVGAAIPSLVAQQQPSTTTPDFVTAAKQISLGNYTGEFANDKRYLDTRQSLLEKGPEMLEHIYRVTGMSLPPSVRVNVVFHSWPKDGWPYGVTTRIGRTWTFRVDYFLGPVFKDRQNVVQIMQHELTHVMLIYWMKGNDRAYPLWLHEGIAMYVGGHGPDVVRRYFSMVRRQLKSSDPQEIASKLFNGIGVHKSAWDYAEDFLALDYFAKTWGEDGFKRFIREITINRAPWKSAILTVTGKDWPAFEKGARDYSVAYIRNLLGAATPAQVAQTSNKPSPPKVARAAPVQPQTPSLPASQPATATPPKAFQTGQSPSGAGACLGAFVEETSDAASLRGVPVPQALRIIAVNEGGPAERAGLEAGDLITAFNGVAVTTRAELQKHLDSLKPGKVVTVNAYRNGKPIMVRVTLGTEP